MVFGVIPCAAHVPPAARGERKAQVKAKSVGYCGLKCNCSKKPERETPKDTPEASKNLPRPAQERILMQHINAKGVSCSN